MKMEFSECVVVRWKSSLFDENSGSRDGDFCRESPDENQMFENVIKRTIQQWMRIPKRESNFCTNQRANDDSECTHDLFKSAYEARHNEARRGKMTNAQKSVLKAKSACQAAATAAHQVEPSGSRDGDFC